MVINPYKRYVFVPRIKIAKRHINQGFFDGYVHENFFLKYDGDWNLEQLVFICVNFNIFS